MALAAKGVISGHLDGSFKPDDAISRAEICTISSLFFSLSGGDMTFTDVSEEHWAHDYIISAAAKGWVGAYTGTDFEPERIITRAEAVEIVNGVLSRVPDETFIDENSDLVKNFGDLMNTHWAYYEIMEAANGHLFTIDESGNETWTELK
jgi:hypothetical protein